MPLPSSGAISLNQMHVEVGGTSGTTASVNDTDIRGLISKGAATQQSFSEYYGASSAPSLQYTAYGTAYIPLTSGKSSSPAGFNFFSSAARDIVVAASNIPSSAAYGLYMNNYGIFQSSTQGLGGSGVNFAVSDPTYTWRAAESQYYNFSKNHGTGSGQHYIKIYYGSTLLITSNIQNDVNGVPPLNMGHTSITNIVPNSGGVASNARVEYYA
jgi:hypothetical protein